MTPNYRYQIKKGHSKSLNVVDLDFNLLVIKDLNLEEVGISKEELKQRLSSYFGGNLRNYLELVFNVQLDSKYFPEENNEEYRYHGYLIESISEDTYYFYDKRRGKKFKKSVVFPSKDSILFEEFISLIHLSIDSSVLRLVLSQMKDKMLGFSQDFIKETSEEIESIPFLELDQEETFEKNSDLLFSLFESLSKSEESFSLFLSLLDYSPRMTIYLYRVYGKRIYTLFLLYRFIIAKTGFDWLRSKGSLEEVVSEDPFYSAAGIKAMSLSKSLEMLLYYLKGETSILSSSFLEIDTIATSLCKLIPYIILPNGSLGMSKGSVEGDLIYDLDNLNIVYEISNLVHVKAGMVQVNKGFKSDIADKGSLSIGDYIFEKNRVAENLVNYSKEGRLNLKVTYDTKAKKNNYLYSFNLPDLPSYIIAKLHLNEEIHNKLAI